MASFTAFESKLQSQGIFRIAGVDEAGRGPLAGPVVAAAVRFEPDAIIEGIADSKALTPTRREALAAAIEGANADFGIGVASPQEIDEINILQASILAMHRAIASLHNPPEYLLVDGNRFHHPALPFETIVRGDARCYSIAAASILAKVHRDRIMLELDAQYPEYGFARHKGYPTSEHIEAIREFGYTDIHRRSFVVKALVQTEAFAK
ncbi:MAG: ribonuclease HII [Ectothiorhodospiraceae bacterium]|nr:ribonuclease HII [Ectothiorhodospiraceae bacterium]